MYLCIIVWGSRANQRHTPHHRSSRVCEWSLNVRERVCWQQSYMLIKLDNQKTDTFMQISEAYIRLCSHLACCVSIDVQMIYTLSPTRSVKHTCSHLGCSVKHTCSHLAYTSVKHTCSHLACCISIDVQMIYTLSHSHTRLCQQPHSFLVSLENTSAEKQTNKKQIYGYTYTCVYFFIIGWGARANQSHIRHHRSARVCEWSLNVWEHVWQVCW
jgi:hypothetical protein